MGIISLLKSFLTNEENAKNETKKLDLIEINPWLDNISKEKRDIALKKIEKLKPKLDKYKDNIQKSLEKLKTSELKNPHTPQKAVQIMEGNRETYIEKTHHLTANMDVELKFDKLQDFCDNFNKEFNDYASSTKRNYYVLKEFFNDEVTDISTNLNNFYDLVINIQQIIGQSEISKIWDLKKKVNKSINNIRYKKTIKEEIDKLEKEYKNLVQKLDDEQKILNKIKQSPAYHEYESFVKQKESLDKKKNIIIKEFHEFFYKINVALRKYERTSMESSLITGYISDPIKAISYDSDLKIQKIIESMKCAIENDKLPLKDKKKEKILRAIKDIDNTFFENYVKKINEINRKISDIDKKISASEIVKGYDEQKQKYDKVSNELTQTKNRLNEKKQESEDIEIEKIKHNLSTEIKDIINKDVEIN